jgi:hypothetical protein
MTSEQMTAPCGACQGSQQIAGRVVYVTWHSKASPYETATRLTPSENWMEGNGIPCPYCLPRVYGDIRRVESRKDLPKPEQP